MSSMKRQRWSARSRSSAMSITPCTGYADKCQGNPASCRRKHVREEVLEAQFTELLGQLRFDDEVLEWVRQALHASHADERREHEEAIKRHEAEPKRLQDRIKECRPVARGTEPLPARD
jgi:hypothetical protein